MGNKVNMNFYKLILIVIFVGACSAHKEEKKVGDKWQTFAVDKPSAATSVIRKNLTAVEFYTQTTNLFKDSGFTLKGEDVSQGAFLTNWKGVTERHCNVGRDSNGPVNCHIKFFGRVVELTPLASELRLQLEEICDGEKKYVCAGSAGETYLKEFTSTLQE